MPCSSCNCNYPNHGENVHFSDCKVYLNKKNIGWKKIESVGSTTIITETIPCIHCNCKICDKHFKDCVFLKNQKDVKHLII